MRSSFNVECSVEQKLRMDCKCVIKKMNPIAMSPFVIIKFSRLANVSGRSLKNLGSKSPKTKLDRKSVV